MSLKSGKLYKINGDDPICFLDITFYEDETLVDDEDIILYIGEGITKFCRYRVHIFLLKNKLICRRINDFSPNWLEEINIRNPSCT